MSESQSPKSGTYSERDGHRILARAAELEASGDARFTADDLRQIAKETGIAARAMEEALSESTMEKTQDVVPTVRGRPSTWPVTAASMGLLGVVAGVAAVAADGNSPETITLFAVFGPTAIVTCFRALRHRARGDLNGFLRESVALFGGFVLSAVALQGLSALSPTVAWGTFCTALGAGVVTALRSGREETTMASR